MMYVKNYFLKRQRYAVRDDTFLQLLKFIVFLLIIYLIVRTGRNIYNFHLIDSLEIQYCFLLILLFYTLFFIYPYISSFSLLLLMIFLIVIHALYLKFENDVLNRIIVRMIVLVMYVAMCEFLVNVCPYVMGCLIIDSDKLIFYLQEMELEKYMILRVGHYVLYIEDFRCIYVMYREKFVDYQVILI